jgi:hypothetical protein
MLEVELKSFTAFLKQRSRRLQDCNGDVERQYRDLSTKLQSWYQETSGDKHSTGLERQDDMGADRTCLPLYFVDCKQIHPVSKVTLQELLKGDDRRRFDVRVEKFDFLMAYRLHLTDTSYSI